MYRNSILLAGAFVAAARFADLDFLALPFADFRLVIFVFFSFLAVGFVFAMSVYPALVDSNCVVVQIAMR